MEKDIIFKARVGSHAYGTNIEGSDEDFKGVYIQNPEDVLVNGYREQINVSKDETYYELRRFIELCCTGNPTMLELLYSPEDCVIKKDPAFDMLLKHRDLFLSKACKYSFGGYAFAQIEKAKGLNKKMNWEKEAMVRKTPLDFCYIITPLGSRPLKDWLYYQRDLPYTKQENYGVVSINNARDLYFIYSSKGDLGYHGIINKDHTSNDLCLSSIPVEEMANSHVMSYNKDGYIKHCKDYRSYTEWLEKRNVQRYVDVESHGQKIDGKNLLHCYRLLETGIEIAREGTINVRRPNAQFLIEIRKGKHDLQKLLDQATGLIDRLNEAFDKTSLPHSVDRGFFMKLMINIRKEFYGKDR
jgi:uncharacterized protein